MRKLSLSLAAAASLLASAAAAGVHAQVAAGGGVSVRTNPGSPLRREGYDGTRQSRRAMERAAAKRARRAARNLRNAGGRS